MQRNLEQELEAELNGELEGSWETDRETEGEFAQETYEHEAAAEAENEGQLEAELAAEFEGESESETELVSESLEQEVAEHEAESEAELAAELGESGEFGEHEAGEQFFKRMFRGIGRFVRRNAGFFKKIARVAVPLVGKAVGGLFGGPAGAMLGSKLGSFAASRIRELEQGVTGEMESHEFESSEQEGEYEGQESESESEFEFESPEIEMPEMGEHEQLAELMAHYAARSASEQETEALIGASTTIILSPRDRAALRRVIPNLVRGAAILTRVLRLRRRSRPLVRVVPTIFRTTTRILRRGALRGLPITRQRAARVMALQTRRVLTSPRVCRHVLGRNLSAVRRLAPVGGVSRRSARSRQRYSEVGEI